MKHRYANNTNGVFEIVKSQNFSSDQYDNVKVIRKSYKKSYKKVRCLLKTGGNLGEVRPRSVQVKA